MTKRKQIEWWQQSVKPGDYIQGRMTLYPVRASVHFEAKVHSTYNAGIIAIDEVGTPIFIEWSDLISCCSIVTPGQDVSDIMEEMNAESL